MARLGELLVAARLLTQEQVGQALRAQVVWGGRLGTNLVELGCLDLDGLSRALARQRGIPAALGRHFDRADPVLQQRLPAELAERWCIVPLLRVNGGRRIAIATIDPPEPARVEEIASVFDVSADQIVMSIAAELRVRYHLERVYKIQRGSRFLRAKGKTIPPFPALADVAIPADAEPTPPPQEPPTPDVPAPAPRTRSSPSLPVPLGEVDELASQIDAAIDAASSEAPEESAGRAMRTYIKTLGDMVDAGETTRPLGRIAIRKVAVAPAPTTPPPPCDDAQRVPSSLPEAVRAIRRGPNRDAVAALALRTLEYFVPSCQAALLLVVRGETAIGWKWFCRSGDPQPELAVPLGRPGLVPCAVESNLTTRKHADALGAVDLLLLLALGGGDGDLVIVPVPIAGQVMCLLATSTEPGAAVAEVEAVAAAAGVAFTRMIRDASR